MHIRENTDFYWQKSKSHKCSTIKKKKEKTPVKYNIFGRMTEYKPKLNFQ